MVATIRRYPTFQIELITEDTEIYLTYGTKDLLKNNSIEEAVISLSCKNSMQDDSPVFSLVLLGKDKWDKVLTPNDLIRIKVTPDRKKKEPTNPYIMVGMISEIRKEGEYEQGTLLYRITGRAMTKALINFEVGVIQEVSTIAPSIGWLPDGTENGLHFSGNTAAGIGQELMERFIYQHADYNFSKGKKLNDYLIHEFKSWDEYESLVDPTPFVGYQGSLRQFLEDVAAKPFNEFYFDYTKDGKCAAIMRPTPFDKDKWDELPVIRFTSDIVVEESIGKSDNEMFSVFVVQAPNLASFNSRDLGVYPKYHPELIKKYGYTRLDAQNRYLLSSNMADGADTEEEGQTPQEQPSYSDVSTYIIENKLQDSETLRTKRNDVYKKLKTQYPSMVDSVANGTIDLLKEGNFTEEEYKKLVSTATDEVTGEEEAREKKASEEKLENFTHKLFNWYCENANFYSGDIRVVGNPDYRIGSRILYEDFEQNMTWEFYLESVQHEFSFTNGYTTILGVTRGLPDSGHRRFENLWGKAEDFKGGYFGELDNEAILQQAQLADPTYGTETGDLSWGGGQGGDIPMKALNTARQMTSKQSIYTFGGGRTGSNPFERSPIRVDCSSFIWWCYYLNGVSLNGGKTGMTTDTIKVDSKLGSVSPRGASKVAAKNKLREGDLVYFDTYKIDGHVGIYSGNGKFVGSQSSTGIAEADMTSGYWWEKFNGRVLRYGGVSAISGGGGPGPSLE